MSPMSDYITSRKAVNQVRLKVQKSESTYTLIQDQLESAVASLDKEHGRGAMRVTYSKDHNFIVKYMPGLVYQSAIHSWSDLLMLSLAHLTTTPQPLVPGCWNVGGATFRLEQGMKEADCAICPAPTTTLLPSIVLQVGDSESLSHLRRDAMLWLEDVSAVELVVILTIDPPLAIDPTVPRITVELWKATTLQREVRKVWFADWTLAATPFYILLADIFNGQVPTEYGDNDRVCLDVEALRSRIAVAWPV